jgi:mxaJ protein
VWSNVLYAVGLGAAAIVASLSAASALSAQADGVGSPRAPHAFRVCSDPDNLPFSNEQKEGFENKIAALLAKDLGDSLSYVWWPSRRGFVRMTLGSHRCDVIIGTPQGYDLVLQTKPYYRTAYVALTRRDRRLRITSLDDSVLKSLTIGVNTMGDNYENTPPAHALGARGIYQHIVGFPTIYNAEQRPGDIVDAVAKGTIDVALVWGPLAGYFAKQSNVPLEITVLPDTDRATGFPFSSGMAIGVRRADQGLRDTLNAALDRRRADIDAILHEFGVPLLPPTSATQ